MAIPPTSTFGAGETPGPSPPALTRLENAPEASQGPSAGWPQTCRNLGDGWRPGLPRLRLELIKTCLGDQRRHWLILLCRLGTLSSGVCLLYPTRGHRNVM